MFRSLSPVLMVADIERSIRFYVETLGMNFQGGVVLDSNEYVSQWPCDANLGFAMFSEGEMTLMVQSPASIAGDLPVLADRAIGSSAFLYFKVDALDGLYQQVARSVPLLIELRETFYGMREFGIADPDGYVLMFAQPI